MHPHLPSGLGEGNPHKYDTNEQWILFFIRSIFFREEYTKFDMYSFDPILIRNMTKTTKMMMSQDSRFHDFIAMEKTQHECKHARADYDCLLARQMETKAATDSCRSGTSIIWVVLFVSQIRNVLAFSPPGLVRNARALSLGSQSKVVNSGDSGRIFRNIGIAECRNVGDQDGHKVRWWQWVQVLSLLAMGSCEWYSCVRFCKTCNQKSVPP